MNNNNNAAIPRYPLSEVTNNTNAQFVIKKVCGTSDVLTEQMFSPHRKDYYFFFLVKKGNSRHWVDFLSYQVQPHHLYFTLPHQIHVKERESQTVGSLIAFSEEFITLCNDETIKQLPIIQNNGLKHAIALTAEEEDFLDHLFELMLQEWLVPKAHTQTVLQSYVKIYLVYLSRIYSKLFSNDNNGVKQQALFMQFSALLGEKYAQLHHAGDYADALHITTGHLNSAVKHHTGKTVTDMIQERIMMEAKRLLFHSDMSVKEIGYQLGFEDAAYFNRTFKKHAGMTPLEFRQQTHEKYH